MPVTTSLLATDDTRRFGNQQYEYRHPKGNRGNQGYRHRKSFYNNSTKESSGNYDKDDGEYKRRKYEYRGNQQGYFDNAEQPKGILKARRVDDDEPPKNVQIFQ